MTQRRDRGPGQDPFERDLRDDLAALAARPAPDSLLDRVAAIPSLPGPRRHRAFASLAGGLASVALAAAAIVFLLSARLGPWTPAGPSGPPSGVVAPSASPAATPSLAPSSSPSSTAVPSPSPSPAASAAAAASLPAGFDPVSASFVSADTGWVLGSVAASGAGCGATACAAVARTTDGGQTWALVGAPAAPSTDSTGSLPTGGVATIRFADQRNGWAFGFEALWATHDGGLSWHAVALPGLTSENRLFALAAGNSLVHAALGNPNGIGIVTSPADRDAWSAPSITVQFGAGPVPASQIVLSGAAGWMVEVDRAVVDGARLAGGAWRAWQPPCLGTAGPALIAAADAAHLVAACDIGVWSTPQGEHLYASADGGSTFTEVGTLPLQEVRAIAEPSASTVVIAGTGANGTPEIATSGDGGRTWPDVTRFASGAVTDLGFATATGGAAVVTDAAGDGRLWLTSDGGRTWRVIPAGS